MTRNDHVPMLDKDKLCSTQLAALGNPQMARELAADAGARQIALATVTALDPLVLDVRSRRFLDGMRIALLQVNGDPCVERLTTTLKVQGGSFKFGQMHAGPVVAPEGAPSGVLEWYPKVHPALSVGDELVVADLEWLGGLKSNHEIGVDRPARDTRSAPKADCDANSYASDPEAHKWCCRSHESSEAEWADVLAGRRDRGELNPETWPPIVDEDQFDTPAAGSPTDDAIAPETDGPPSGLTLDDLD